MPIGKNKLGVVIADVAGKSTSAAFYMAEIKGMVVSLATPLQFSQGVVEGSEFPYVSECG